jgi:hypothetical protein
MGGLWVYWISYLDLAIESALIANLFRNGLYRVYRFFFAYLAADAIETTPALIFQSNGRVYGEIYFAGQIAKVVLGFFVVLEIYQHALAKHPALAKFGRSMAGYALVCAALISALAISVDRAIPAGRSQVVHRFNTFERSMDLWMLVLLAMIGLFIMWFPVRLKRNGVLYICGFLIYFLSRSAGLLFRNLAPQHNRSIEYGIATAAIACLTVWLTCLSPKGEEITTVVGHRWRPAEAARLVGQLDAINAKLMRYSRR